MNKAAETHELVLNISAAERETGLSKDVLRMWERRYAFPKPSRDDNGEAAQWLNQLRKREPDAQRTRDLQALADR